MSPTKYQPRFVAYCNAVGRDPDEVVAAGRFGADFICWINRQWAEWCKANGKPRHQPKSPADHASFDDFIGAPK